MAHRAIKELTAWLVGVACVVIVSLVAVIGTLLTADYAGAIRVDIVDQIRKGMTKEEVLAIAGEPGYRSENDPANKIRGEVDRWSYSVRYRRGFGTYSDPLRLEFKNGRCIEAEH